MLQVLQGYKAKEVGTGVTGSQVQGDPGKGGGHRGVTGLQGEGGGYRCNRDTRLRRWVQVLHNYKAKEVHATEVVGICVTGLQGEGSAEK